VSRSWDTTALVWDLTQVRGQPEPRHQDLKREELWAKWNGLYDEDAARAYRSLTRLSEVPEQAVSFLEEHLQPVPVVTPKRIAALLGELDDDDFAVRERATEELKHLREQVEREVRKILEAQPSAEACRRLAEVVAEWEKPVPPAERLRMARALEILEQIGTPAARRALERLSQGAPQAWLTREAEAGRQRLARRSGVPGR
jgi:hypothetical protein